MRGGSVELVVSVDEAWRTMSAGRKSCSVDRSVPGAPYICSGWCKASNRGMESADGGGASMQCEFSTIVGSDGVETVSRGFVGVIRHYMLRRGGE
jgi:hypothetical protein